jgi:aryl-alcohol dehydrogenase-like predicted oxidoreductase
VRFCTFGRQKCRNLQLLGGYMERRQIGSLDVSVIGIGTNNFTEYFRDRCDQADATRLIHAALDAGVNLIDTAEEYSVVSAGAAGYSEQFIGEALGSRRDEVLIATKFSNPPRPQGRGAGARRVIEAVEGSLRRLKTDRIDLLQQHFPDPETPLSETLEALDLLVTQGKVREIGCCNFDGARLQEAIACSRVAGRPTYVSAQNKYNLLEVDPEAGLLEECANSRVGLLAHTPLANGLLTGKYRRGERPPADSRLGSGTRISQLVRGIEWTDDHFTRVDRLQAYAREHDHSVLELAVAWLLAQRSVVAVITGATRPEQIHANAAAAGWVLTDVQLAAVNEIAQTKAEPCARRSHTGTGSTGPPLGLRLSGRERLRHNPTA